MKTIQTTYCKRFDNSCYHHQCIANNRSYRNVHNMSFVSFSLAVIFIIRLFSTSAFRVLCVPSKVRNCATAQYHQAICALNPILAHLQHSKFNTVCIHISHSPFNAWNASLFVCLLESCAVRVNPRWLRVPVFTGQVREPAENACGSVPSPWGSFWGRSPPNKDPIPPNWNMTHYTSVEFLSIFRMLTPPHKPKALLLKTFWRRFRCGYEAGAG